MQVAASLEKMGYPEENREFVEALGSLERRMRHPLETMGEGSSGDELTSDEEHGGYKLVSLEEARRRRKERDAEEAAARKVQTPASRGGTTHASAGEPMQGVEELGGAPSKPTAVVKVNKKPAPVKAASSTSKPVVNPPRRPSPSGASTSKPPARNLHVPKPPPFPVVAAAPVASTSKLPPKPLAASKVAPSSKKHPLPTADSDDSDIEIIDDPPPPSKRKAVPPSPPSRARTSPAKKASAANTSTSRSPKKKGKQHTITQEVEDDKKKVKKDPKYLHNTYRSLAKYIDHLAAVAETSPPQHDTFGGMRILVVYPDPHTGQREYVNRLEHNRVDSHLADRLGYLAEHGARLVKVHEYVAPPAGYQDEAGEWTTHILVPEVGPMKDRPLPTFKIVLECLGITVEQLGPDVHVVREGWAHACLEARRKKEHARPKVFPAAFALRDDPRRADKVSKRSPAKKAKAKAGGKAAQLVHSDSDDGRSGHESEGEEELARAIISPFGSQDFPIGERPPPGFVARPSNPTAATSSTTSDPIRDLPPTAPVPVSDHKAMPEGLEEQDLFIHEHGVDATDEQIGLSAEEAERKDKRPLDPEDMVILSLREDDNETEEEDNGRREDTEDDDPNYRKFARSKGKKVRYQRTGQGYACDRGSTDRPREENPNEVTAVVLELLAREAHGDQWRVRGYSRAAGALRNTSHYVKTYQQAIKISTIGPSIASKVVEIVRTGTHRRLSSVTPKNKAISTFSYIYGVGARVAEDLYRLGARTLDDLKDDPVRYHLTEAQLLGLEFYDNLKERISRDEVTALYQYALTAAKEIDPKLEVHCMGSYRRGQPDCGDMDLLVTRDPSDGIDHTGMINQLWTILKKRGVIRHHLTSSDDWRALDAKFNALCSLPMPGAKMRRLDILGVPWDEMPAALIYFTGNDHFNRSMRLKARHHGYRLNQRGIYKDVSRGSDGLKLTSGVKIPCKSEQEIFAVLNVPYRPPTERMP